MNRPAAALAVLLLPLLMASCRRQGGRQLAHAYRSPRGHVWSRTDTLRFPLPEAEEGDYLLSVGLRLGNPYPYNDMWLVAETRLSNPLYTRRDTVRFAASALSGAPAATGVNLKQSEQPVSTLPLGEGQTGEILIYHIMAREELPHVVGVGLNVAHQ